MDDKTAQQAKGLSNFVWQIAETLRGDFKQSEYGKVILPFVVLRRLDCILEPSKAAILEAHFRLPEGIDQQTRDMLLYGAASVHLGGRGRGLLVYNTSPLDFARIRQQNPADAHDNLIAYIREFSESVRDVFLDKFLFTDQLKRLNEAAILWKVFEQFAALDLRPQSVTTLAMGYLFEDLIRRFSEVSNETAGEHFTPREVIRLIVDLLLVNDAQALTGRGIIRQVYDPACGTGGMLALTEEGMKNLNPDIRVELFGQELNGESFGICKSDMLVTGHDPENIAFGNTLTLLSLSKGSQGRDVDRHAFMAEALALAMQRQMKAKLGHHHLGQEVRAGSTPWDRMEGGRGLRDRLAVAAGEALTHVLDHHPACRDPLQGLGDVFAERAQACPATAGAGRRGGMDDALARQMLGQGPAGGLAPGGRRGGVRVGLAGRLRVRLGQPRHWSARMPTRNINLTDHLDAFIEGGISSGQYKNASEVVREGLRLLEQRQAEDALRLQRLRKAVRVGEEAFERGEFEDVELKDLGSYLAGLGATARQSTGA